MPFPKVDWKVTDDFELKLVDIKDLDKYKINFGG